MEFFLKYFKKLLSFLVASVIAMYVYQIFIGFFVGAPFIESLNPFSVFENIIEIVYFSSILFLGGNIFIWIILILLVPFVPLKRKNDINLQQSNFSQPLTFNRILRIILILLGLVLLIVIIPLIINYIFFSN